MGAEEVPLLGGVNAGEVVRVGDTVRRRTGPWTSVAHALLQHFEREGFDGAPRVLGIDELGREILTFAPGCAIAPGAVEMLRDDELLFALGRLVSDFHRASATFEPPTNFRWPFAPDPAGGPILLHNDLGAWNIVSGADRLTIIDWDGVSPGRPEWELALSLVSFVELWPEFDQTDSEIARRIRVFADGYRLAATSLALALQLIPDRCRHCGAMIETGAARGEVTALALQDRGFVTYFSQVADMATSRVPEWLRRLM